jgi:hypothetical protein
MVDVPLKQQKPQPGVYVGLDDLVALQYKARGFSFLPRQPIHSILAGRHASRLRGRGLNFEEIRRYLPGDDVRQIDWKVTARTRKTHTGFYRGAGTFRVVGCGSADDHVFRQRTQYEVRYRC